VQPPHHWRAREVLVALMEKSCGVWLLFVREERIVVAIALVEDPHIGVVGAGVGDIRHGAGFRARDCGHCIGDQPVELLAVAVTDLELDDECEHFGPFLALRIAGGGIDIVRASQEKGYRTKMRWCRSARVRWASLSIWVG